MGIWKIESEDKEGIPILDPKVIRKEHAFKVRALQYHRPRQVCITSRVFVACANNFLLANNNSFTG